MAIDIFIDDLAVRGPSAGRSAIVAPTITVTADPAHGRARVEVVWPDVNRVLITRLRAGATTGTIVRSMLPLVGDDGYGVYTRMSGIRGIWYDSEVPLDVPVVYVATSADSGASATSLSILLPSGGGGWLRNPLKPELDVRLSIDSSVGDPFCKPGRAVYYQGLTDATRQADSVSLNVPNRARPVVSAGSRKAPTSSLRLVTRQLADRDALEALLADGTALLLQLPAVYGEADQYIDVKDVVEGRITVDQRRPWRVLSLPFVQVDAPQGLMEAPAGVAIADLCGPYATWAAVTAAGRTWLDLARAVT